MFSKSKAIGSLAGLGFFLALTPNIGLAEMEMPASAGEKTSQFQKIEQPLGLKLAVAVAAILIMKMTKAIFQKMSSIKLNSFVSQLNFAGLILHLSF